MLPALPFTDPVRRRSRHKPETLQPRTDACDETVADLLALQLAGDRLEERPAVDPDQRLGGTHDGVHLVVGEPQRRRGFWFTDRRRRRLWLRAGQSDGRMIEEVEV